MGGKKIPNLGLSYSQEFKKRIRCNVNLQGEVDSEKDLFYLNVHVFDNFIKNKKPLEFLLNRYNFVDSKNIKKFQNIIKLLKNKPYRTTNKKLGYYTKKFNKILENLNSKYFFIKDPRCGYKAIVDQIELGLKPIILGFSYKKKCSNNTYLQNKSLKKSKIEYHDYDSERDVLLFLHNIDKIDITPCMLEPFILPLLDCDNLQPKEYFIEYCLNNSGCCILKNIQNISSILKYFENCFKLDTKSEMWEKKDFDQYIITKPQEEVKIIKSTEILDYKNLSEEILSETEVKVQKNTELLILIKAGTIYKY